MGVEINSRTVMRAVHSLGDQRSGWPTAERIAEYLDAPADEVLRHLRDLKRKRLYIDRRRNGERVWMPWEET